MLNLSLSQSSPLESLYDLFLGASATRLGGDQLAGPAGGGQVARLNAVRRLLKLARACIATLYFACDLPRGGILSRYRGRGD